MRTKTFTLDVTTGEAKQIATALHAFAYAAYPPGGSECSQVAHETLIDSARQVAQQAAGNGPAPLRRRQRTLLKAAVQWYFSDEGPGDVEQCAEIVSKFP